VSVQDRSMVCARRTICSEIVLDTLVGTSRCEAQVEACFGPFGHSANLDTRYVHDLCRQYHRLKNCFGHT
jgi:hypothetical protein